MPKARSRKKPVTSEFSTGASASSSSPHSSRALIRRFHTLLKKRARIEDSGASTEALADVENEMEKLGGLSAYQRMSSIGQGDDRGGGCQKVLIGWLKDMALHKTGEKLRHVLMNILCILDIRTLLPIRLLDVG